MHIRLDEGWLARIFLFLQNLRLKVYIEDSLNLHEGQSRLVEGRSQFILSVCVCVCVC